MIRRQKGFTLIELLVVIAIIAILAAILFPVFAKAKDKARQATCLSNVKQLVLSLTMYLQDWGETYPPTVTERESPDGAIANDADALQFSIRGRLNPYVPGNLTSSSLFKCPNAKPWVNISTGNAGAPSTSVIYYPNDYGFNINEGLLSAASHPGHTFSGVKAASVTYFTDNPTFGFNENLRETSIQNPVGFLVIIDSARPDGALGRGSVTPQYVDLVTGKADSYDPGSAAAGHWSPQNGQAAVSGRHSNGANAGYADGHAQFRALGQLWRSKIDNDFRWDSSSN